MYLSANLPSAVLLLSTFATAGAFRVNYFTGPGCRGGGGGELVQRPEQGCSKYMAGVASSQRLTGDSSDKSLYMVYFSSEDCDPDTIIMKSDLGKNYEPHCVDVNYQSFQVYDVCDTLNCLD